MILVLANDSKEKSALEFIKQVKNTNPHIAHNSYYYGDRDFSIKPFEMVSFEINELDIKIHKLIKLDNMDDVVYVNYEFGN